jgi:hypothetical protein
MASKIQTAVRLNKDLLQALKEKAKADNRSLNNYIEKLLYEDVGLIPNQEARSAIKDTQSGKLEKL